MIIQLPNMLDGLIDGLIDFCTTFNEFMEVLFPLLKYSLIFILLSVGYLTIRMYRGENKGSRQTETNVSGEKKPLTKKLKEPHVILGIIYLALGIGILLGWMTQAFIIVLDPIPDAFIFKFINFSGWIPAEELGRIQDPNLAIYPYEITIYYGVSFFSFLGFTSLIMGMRFMILYANKSHTTSLKMFITGLVDCIFMGFTTFMPLFLKF